MIHWLRRFNCRAICEGPARCEHRRKQANPCRLLLKPLFFGEARKVIGPAGHEALVAYEPFIPSDPSDKPRGERRVGYGARWRHARLLSAFPKSATITPSRENGAGYPPIAAYVLDRGNSVSSGE